MAAVRDMTVDNPLQQRRISDLERLAAQRLDLANKNIDSIRNNQPLPTAPQSSRAGPGLQIMVDYQAICFGQMQGRRTPIVGASQRDRGAEQKPYQIYSASWNRAGPVSLPPPRTVQRDNSRRQIAEKALQESERKYRMLIQGIKNYAIYMLGPRGEIRTWNPGAERMTGCGYEEVVGQNFSRFFFAEDVKHGQAAGDSSRAPASGQYEEQGMRAVFAERPACLVLRTDRLRRLFEVSPAACPV